EGFQSVQGTARDLMRGTMTVTDIDRSDTTSLQAPVAAAGLLANLPEGVERNRATLAAVDAWSAPAPAATAAWVETLPAGETRDEAFRRMTLAWSGQDLEAAMAWQKNPRREVSGSMLP
ncbi:MAG: hypothetical protein ACREIA_13225, partial [Opitutaceae bacterium]